VPSFAAHYMNVRYRMNCDSCTFSLWYRLGSGPIDLWSALDFHMNTRIAVSDLAVFSVCSSGLQLRSKVDPIKFFACLLASGFGWWTMKEGTSCGYRPRS